MVVEGVVGDLGADESAVERVAALDSRANQDV